MIDEAAELFEYQGISGFSALGVYRYTKLASRFKPRNGIKSVRNVIPKLFREDFVLSGISFIGSVI